MIPATRPAPLSLRNLPHDFTWGVATASYQIEGAVAEDGRVPSIWDTFSRTPGAVANGDTGEVANDHYHRMPSDVALIKSLGVDAYRFSIAWPRAADLSFYDRLVDELLANDIQPWATLYHWDLPQELEDAGGWPNRDTAYKFADHAAMVFGRLQDRVDTFTTLNEPWCSAWLGYATGVHAPGRRSPQAGIDAAHHLLLGHGLALQAMRAAETRPHKYVISLNTGTANPIADRTVDHGAAYRADGMGLRLYLDPLRRGAYPADVVRDLAYRGITIPVRDGDLELISQPFDLLGCNFYFGQNFAGTDEAGNTHDASGAPVVRAIMPETPRTSMNWPITPSRFTQLLLRLAHDYPGLPLVVTENGAAFEDIVEPDGTVRDDERTEYLSAHLAAVAEAVAQGVDVRGYFCWSLLDNFEWTEGYAKRFGLFHVDYDTFARTPKQSAHWFRETIERTRG
jgi:beta-glucosidase